jgi:hypothetical protein
MPRKAFIEPLPQHKAIAFYVILGLGTAMLIAVASSAPQGFLPSLFQGLGTSFIAVALVDLIPEMVRRRQEARARRTVIHFFGKEGIKNGFHLVSAERTLKPTELKHLYAPGAPDTYVSKGARHQIKNNQDQTMNALPEGVRSWIAEQDIRAASYIGSLFGRENIGFSIGIDTDENKRLSHTSLITIGLGFNACTNHLSDLPFDDGPAHLFRIHWGTSERDSTLGTTDQLIIGNKTVELSAGDLAGDFDYALVARIVAWPESGHVQFVCAGRSANGTAVAGYFLANCWRELADEYKNESEMDTHSLAVIIQHKTSEADAGDLDSTGRICKDYGIVKARCSIRAEAGAR